MTEIEKLTEAEKIEILKNDQHRLFDALRFAQMAGNIDLDEIDYSAVSDAAVESHDKADADFPRGTCRICGETAKTCECH
mgnify:CR=1 FL=1